MSSFVHIVRYSFALILFLTTNGVAIWLIGAGLSKIGLVGLLGLAIIATFIAERIAPYEPIWNQAQGDRARDIIHAIVNEGSTIFAVILLPLISSFGVGANLWPRDWPLWTQLLTAILIADFGITLAHYASHRISWLWRLHAVHHSVRRLYGFNGLMKHPLHQTIELIAGTLPLILLGITQDIAALLALAVAVQLLLQHTNTDIRVGPLTYVWAVAPGHRLHHRASETEGDVNFGLFTLIWDHMLGTFRHPLDQVREDEIGLARRKNYPVSYSDQLIEPFRKAHE